MGVVDIVLEWREERITITKQPRGSRTVRYRHYLDELAAKPQAVRQLAPELMAELDAPVTPAVAGYSIAPQFRSIADQRNVQVVVTESPK